jgi:hypothetical protein
MARCLYEIRPRKDHRGIDLISDALPFRRLWYGEPNAVGNAIDYAKHRSRSHHAVIRVYNAAGNVIETHEHAHALRAVSAVVSPGLVTALCPAGLESARGTEGPLYPADGLYLVL